MKKVLLTTLAIAVAMAGFAQKGQERVKAEQPRSAKANIQMGIPIFTDCSDKGAKIEIFRICQ